MMKILLKVRNIYKNMGRRMKFAQGFALGLGAVTFLSYATVTIPHFFISGDFISSNEVNQNFSGLASEINTNQSNISALQSQVSQLQAELNLVKPALVGTWGGGVGEEILVCTDMSTNPTFPAQSQGIIDSSGNVFFNPGNRVFTVPQAGAYEFLVIAPESTKGQYSSLHYKLKINNVDLEFVTSRIVSLLQGDEVELWLGCSNYMDTGTNYIINTAKFLYLVKKF